jgi:hypothetical protein
LASVAKVVQDCRHFDGTLGRLRLNHRPDNRRKPFFNKDLRNEPSGWHEKCESDAMCGDPRMAAPTNPPCSYFSAEKESIMRRTALTLAALAVVGLAANTALAQRYRGQSGGYGGGVNVQVHVNNHNYNYNLNTGGRSQRGYSPGYGSYGSYGRPTYGSYRAPSSYFNSRGANSHTAAVRRIMAHHSRYRYTTHPRSLQNSPPYRYGYRGW